MDTEYKRIEWLDPRSEGMVRMLLCQERVSYDSPPCGDDVTGSNSGALVNGHPVGA